MKYTTLENACYNLRQISKQFICPPDKFFGSLADKIENLGKEKSRRIYYQDIVYYVCNILDKFREEKIVCGTVDSPSYEVQNMMDTILEKLSPLDESKLE